MPGTFNQISGGGPQVIPCVRDARPKFFNHHQKTKLISLIRFL
jgi:hypothetical protein